MTDIALVNMAWQLGGNAELLAQASAHAQVMLLCEALADGGKKVARIGPLLPDGWSTNQVTSNPAMAGVAVCWRNDSMSHMSDTLARMSPAAHDVRARYLSAAMLGARGSGDMRRYGVTHSPLLKTGVKDDSDRSLRQWVKTHDKALVGLDSNRPPAKLQQMLHGLPVKVIGAEVMCMIIPRDVHVTAQSSEHTVYSDHPIYRVSTQNKPTHHKDWWNNV